MVVQHNLSSMNANRMLGISTVIKGKSSEKLSSGYKINRAADDAAGLQISEKMRSQIRGLTQASDNTQDGVSFCQIADGALDEVQGMLKRCTELSVKAANGTNTDTDRQAIQAEISEISKEIDRVHESAIFNELRVFPDAGNRPETVVSGVTGVTGRTVVAGNTVITLEFIDSEGNRITDEPNANIKGIGDTNPSKVKDSTMAQFVVDAAASAVGKIAARYPNLFGAASTKNIQVGLELSAQGKGGTLATASLAISANSTSTVASYKMWVDTADYPIEDFDSMTTAQKADLAAVVAHEMTHLVMDDTLTGGMLGTFPKWFKEGMAQTSSGDNGWMSELSPTSSDSDITGYIAQLTTMPYGAGYAGCMYLGHLISGESTVSSESIAKGLDMLLTKVADNISNEGSNSATILDNALNSLTGGKYTSVQDFETKFSSAADPTILPFMHELLNKVGTTGAGSILVNLGDTEEDLLAASYVPYGSYNVNKDHMWYSNAFGTGFAFPENLPSTGGGGGVGNDRDGFIIQAGAANREEQQIFVKQFNISCESLFDNMEMDVSTLNGARSTIALVEKADAKVSAVRSYYGAMQNRLEHTIANLDNIVENTTGAESQIRDTDMAKEMVTFTKTNVLIQAGNAMLSQAMQTPQNVLQLLS